MSRRQVLTLLGDSDLNPNQVYMERIEDADTLQKLMDAGHTEVVYWMVVASGDYFKPTVTVWAVDRRGCAEYPQPVYEFGIFEDTNGDTFDRVISYVQHAGDLIYVWGIKKGDTTHLRALV